MKPPLIAHVITGLEVGGAERMLAELTRRLPAEEFDQEVISLTERGELADVMEAAGVPVLALGGGAGPSALAGFLRLARRLRARSPALVHTWLYHADLAGGLAAPLAGAPPVIWSLRQGTPRDLTAGTRAVLAACGALSRRLPTVIVANSEASLRVHAGLGYDRGRMRVIPNGIDLDRFRPDPEARRALRDELGVSPDILLVGYVARWNPQKDHRTFLRAASALSADRPEVHFVLCGRGVTPENPELARQIGEGPLGERLHLLGLRRDVALVTAALDVATLAARSGESFPTVVAEAMACGVPVVATDVGAAREIVGETGVVVPPEQPDALRVGWERALDLPDAERRELGRRARERIAGRWEIGRIVDRYRELYGSLLGRDGDARERVP